MLTPELETPERIRALKSVKSVNGWNRFVPRIISTNPQTVNCLAVILGPMRRESASPCRQPIKKGRNKYTKIQALTIARTVNLVQRMAAVIRVLAKPPIKGWPCTANGAGWEFSTSVREDSLLYKGQLGKRGRVGEGKL